MNHAELLKYYSLVSVETILFSKVIILNLIHEDQKENIFYAIMFSSIYVACNKSWSIYKYEVHITASTTWLLPYLERTNVIAFRFFRRELFLVKCNLGYFCSFEAITAEANLWLCYPQNTDEIWCTGWRKIAFHSLGTKWAPVLLAPRWKLQRNGKLALFLWWNRSKLHSLQKAVPIATGV